MATILKTSDATVLEKESTKPVRVVDVQHLSVGFPTDAGLRRVVHDVSFHINSGEIVAFVGESGSGKSVSARALIGLSGNGASIKAQHFQVFDESVLNYQEKEWQRLRGGKIGLIHQDALVSLDPLRKVGKEVGEVILAHDAFISKRDAAQRALEYLRAAGISDAERRYQEYSFQLSGGLRQRALIASGIAGEPKLLITDEPTTALDVTVQQQILELIKQRQDLGNTILLISHDLAVVAQLADRIYVFRHGEIVESGPTDRILLDPQHEYTRSLRRAIPSRQTKGQRLSGAEVPDAHLEKTPIFLPERHIDESKNVIEARGVTKTFKARRGRRTVAVDDVDFDVRAGETLGIVGESGSGKTTIARIVLGLVKPTAGTVRVNGEPWSQLDDRKRLKRRHLVQFVAQDPLSSFDPYFSVERIIAESLDTLAIDRVQKRERVRSLLDAVGLSKDFIDRKPQQLSGGERQRVAIARALAPEPSIIVADEPVSALDVSVQAQILDLFAETQTERGLSLVFISHDLGVIHHIADRVLVVKNGQIVESGNVEDVLERPQNEYTRRLIEAIPTLPTR